MIWLRVTSLLLIVTILLPSVEVWSINFSSSNFWSRVYLYTGWYGSGVDGALSVNGVVNGPTNPLEINTVSTAVTALAASSVSVVSTAGFVVGRQVLLIQMTGPNNGRFEFLTVNGINALELTFNSNIKNTYAVSGTQVILVPEYTNVSVNSGAFLTVPSWNGSTGGVMVFKASGTLSIDNGGGGLHGSVSVGRMISPVSIQPKGFAGGSTGMAGTGPGGGSVANGGRNTSSADLQTIALGSGGGGSAALGIGGRGAGLIIIHAANVQLGGEINATGAQGGGPGAGGGAGGSVLLYTETLAPNGTCGQIVAEGGASNGVGTAGASGRLVLNYKDNITCQPGVPAGNTTYRKFKGQ